MRQVDVKDEASVGEMFEAAERELGTPHILVNKASMGASGTAVADTGTQRFDSVVRTDVYRPFFCCREFMRRRRAAGASARSST